MFAVSQFTTMPCDAEQDIQSYVAAGVEGIEICESKFPDDPTQRKELAALVKGGPMAVTSVQAEVHSIFPDRLASEPAAPRERLEAFKRSIDYWSEAFATPGLPFVLIAGVPPDQNFKNAWSEAIRFIKDATAFAEKNGVSIAFEPLGPGMMYFDTFIYGLDQGVRLIDAAESESAGLVVDSFHIWEEHDLINRLTKLAPRVSVVHVSDWPVAGPRALDDRLLPGDGVIRLPQRILNPLRAGGYKGPFTVEVLSDTNLPDSLWQLDPADLLQRAKRAVTAL